MADVIVTNKGREDFDGMFNGVTYHLDAGGSLPMPEEAARHVFGFGLKDPERISIGLRHGWHVGRDREGNVIQLNNLQVLKRFEAFTVAATRLVADESEAPTPTLAPKSRRQESE